MQWTSEKPTESGFYWLRRAGERDTIVEIEPVKFYTYIHFIGTDEDNLVDYIHNGLWYGPLEPPSMEKA